MDSQAGQILVLTHSALDGPGLLEPWAAACGYRLDLCRADLQPALPDPRGYAAVIVLGSVESAASTTVGWVARERGAVEAAIDGQVPVLGICFGGQMLAQALGGRISACRPAEVGWHVIESSDPLTVPPGPWLLWHEEKFTVPAGGQEIARTGACPQAFRYGPHLGLQFHPEATAGLLRSWVDEADGRGTLSGQARNALLAGGRVVPGEASPEQSSHLFTTFASRAGLLPPGTAGSCPGSGSLVR